MPAPCAAKSALPAPRPRLPRLVARIRLCGLHTCADGHITHIARVRGCAHRERKERNMKAILIILVF
eukprot:scaffold14769_cov116-Isochrysis_galbana.AAC.2